MKGKIIKGIGGFYFVKTTDGLIECKARGKFRHRDMKPLVGDDVEIVVEHGKGVICDIHERKSELIRPTVANVTQAFVVFAIKTPDINYDLLNRFLVLCEHNNIKAIVCLNKVDVVVLDHFSKKEECGIIGNSYCLLHIMCYHDNSIIFFQICRKIFYFRSGNRI